MDRFRQETNDAQLTFTYPGKFCKKTGKKHSCHEPACAEIIGHTPMTRKPV